MSGWFWFLAWPPAAFGAALIVGPALRRRQPPASSSPTAPEEGNRS